MSPDFLIVRFDDGVALVKTIDEELLCSIDAGFRLVFPALGVQVTNNDVVIQIFENTEGIGVE